MSQNECKCFRNTKSKCLKHEADDISGFFATETRNKMVVNSTMACRFWQQRFCSERVKNDFPSCFLLVLLEWSQCKTWYDLQDKHAWGSRVRFVALDIALSSRRIEIYGVDILLVTLKPIHGLKNKLPQGRLLCKCINSKVLTLFVDSFFVQVIGK